MTSIMLALPSKGRIQEEAIAVFEKSGLTIERPGGARDLPPLALLRALVAERGVSGLWRGAAPVVARAFPANAAQWLAWEFASRALRADRLERS